MPDTPDERAATTGRKACLEISLQPAGSSIRGTGGKEVPFSRAILKIRNVCDAEVINIVLHATLGQEGGTVQDVSGPFLQPAPLSIPANGSVDWDVYDLLLPAHQGTASKVHMFGYRAVLNWRFELAVSAEYQTPVSFLPAHMPVSRWVLRWSVVDPATGEIGLAIEEAKV